MAEDVAELGIKVNSKGVVKATGDLKKLENQSGKNETKNDKLGKSFGLLKGAVLGLAGTMAVSTFIRTAGEFESLKVSLETVTGSAEKANMAFSGILEFAQNTPFSVQELTQSFIKLKALGIEPTEANLESFGNTASAMGKSLNQMIEAVADAATGEFERLKEFGIKAKSEGDNVSFTFQGVTKTVKKNSEEITRYLQGIGETQFAGAMSKQMDTINGKISNLGDTWDSVILSFSEAGAGESAKAILTGMTDALDVLGDGIDLLPTAFFRTFGAFDKMVAMIVMGAKSAHNEFKSLWESDEKTLEQQRLINAEFNKRIHLIDLATDATVKGEEKRLAAAAGGIDVAGAGGKAKQTEAEIAAEQAKNDQLLAMGIAFREADDEARRESLEERLAGEAELELFAEAMRIQNVQILEEQAKAQAAADTQMKVDSLKTTVGLMSQLTQSSSKKMFQVGKAASLASTAMSTYAAVIETFKNNGGYPWGIAPAAAMAAVGAVQLQNISSQQFAGQAHDGMDNVPRTGSYILEQGEAVIKKKEAGKIRAGDVGGGVASITFAPVIQAFDADDVMKNKDKLFVGLRNMFVDWMHEEGVKFA